jgi:peptidoglycan hydrolase-like protein with peptidoglycan-binding domain
MTIRDAIEWFQTSFAKELEKTLAGTPFSQDIVAAIAYQETGYIWRPLVERKLSKGDVLRFCVGDTLDADRGRRAFPATKAKCLAHPQGAALFAVARKALVEMAKAVPAYGKVARNPNKFCHGFGIFQYDIQFFLNDPDFFLNELWCDAAECFKRLLVELFAAKKRMGWAGKPTLTPAEQVFVAIAYNKGTADVAKGLKQGHKNDEGKFYGELVSAYFDIARSIPDDPGTANGGGPALNVTREEPFAPLPGKKAAPAYPGRLIKKDSGDTAAVKLIQQRLRDLGYTQPRRKGGVEPLGADGEFGANTEAAVELFQARHTNAHGAPLDVDGEVGSDTWGALFGAATVPKSDDGPAASGILAAALDVASKEVGVLEVPPGSNGGKRVEEYQRTVGISKGDAWCVAFVYWCFKQAAAGIGIANPMEKDCRTGGVLDLWNRARRAAKVKTISTREALDNPGTLKPGMVFIIETGGGKGHTGIVSRIVGNRLETIEGNTNDGGSREGIGVFRRNGRTVDSINRGFINFGG